MLKRKTQAQRLAEIVLCVRGDPTFQYGARLRKSEVEFLNLAICEALDMVKKAPADA